MSDEPIATPKCPVCHSPVTIATETLRFTLDGTTQTDTCYTVTCPEEVCGWEMITYQREHVAALYT